jgi:hypothetical protein
MAVAYAGGMQRLAEGERVWDRYCQVDWGDDDEDQDDKTEDVEEEKAISAVSASKNGQLSASEDRQQLVDSGRILQARGSGSEREALPPARNEQDADVSMSMSSSQEEAEHGVQVGSRSRGTRGVPAGQGRVNHLKTKLDSLHQEWRQQVEDLAREAAIPPEYESYVHTDEDYLREFDEREYIKAFL